MSDKDTLLEKETDEQVTTTEEESGDSESESQEESTETTESQETEESVKEYDTEEDWFESLGVGRKNGEDIAKEYLQMRERLDALEQHRAETNFTPIQQTQQQKTAERRFLEAKARAKKHIESLRFNDDEKGKMARQSYEAMSSLVDSVLDPVIDETENGLQTVLQGMGAIVRHLQRQSYDNSRHKHLVRFEDIEKDMLQNFLLDADRGIRNFIVNNKPELLSQLQQKAKEEGQREGQRKLLKKFSTARRQKQTTQTGVDWKPYFTHGEPNEKFNSLPTANRLKVAEAYQKAAQREYEGR